MCDQISSIGIIGYGKFGKLLEEIISEHAQRCELRIFSKDQQVDGKKFFNLSDTVQSSALILAVPIRELENCLKEISPHLVSGTTVIDVCSVKTYPKKLMLEQLPENVGIMCTHPMFGPSTYRFMQGDSNGLRLVVERLRDTNKIFDELEKFCQKIGVDLIEMDCEQHDRMAAHFHFLALSAASILKPLKLEKTKISTASADTLVDFLDMVSTNESLLIDIFEFNPYCKPELDKMKIAFNQYLELFE